MTNFIPQTAAGPNGSKVASLADVQSVLGTKLDIAPVAATQTKHVYIGSTRPGYANLANPTSIPQLLDAGSIGLYQHANGNSALTPAQRMALWATWGITGVTPTGQGQSIGEVGGFVPVPADYLAYFGGAYPNEVNMNIITGSGDGSGSYTAVTGDASPGAVYTGYTSAADLATMKTAIDAAMAAGAKNVAIFMTPNGGGEDLADPFATGAYWANVRAAALYGGGIALDCPPTYWVLRGGPYQSIVAQMIAWANTNGLRSSLTVSPYAQNPDNAGHSGNMGFDPVFMSNLQLMSLYLQDFGAMPSQWVVENYGEAGTGNDVEQDGQPNSLNAAALYLARTLNPTKAAIKAPAAAGGVADQGLMDTALAISPIRAGVPLPPVGPVRIADVLGAGQMASQDRSSVSITGGSVTGVTIGATAGTLENVSIGGNSPISTTATPIFQTGVIVQSQAPGGGIFYINGDTPGGNTIWLTKPGGAPADLRVNSIGATPNTRPGSVATINLDASGAVALGGLLTIGAQGRSALANADPHNAGQIWADSTGVLHVSAG